MDEDEGTLVVIGIRIIGVEELDMMIDFVVEVGPKKETAEIL